MYNVEGEFRSHMSGMRVHERVQRMVDTGNLLWVGQDLKWVGTEEYVEDLEENIEKEDVEIKDESSWEDIVSEDELDVGIKLTDKSKVKKSRSKKHKVSIARGFMVEPPENASKAITRMRRKLKEEYEMERWECTYGSNEEALAARKQIHKEWFHRQLRQMVPSSKVPVAVSGSNPCSASSGSDTEPECVESDGEDDAEMITGIIEGWIVPGPSPIGIDEPEFELEEPRTDPTSWRQPRKRKHKPQPHTDGQIYPKPPFSYTSLIGLALKNSKTGCLNVSEIYKFMCDHFPYFKSTPTRWKNSVRHNLSLKKCFEKIEMQGTGVRKRWLYTINPARVHKLDEEVQTCSRKYPIEIRQAMSDSQNLELIEKGELKPDYTTGNTGSNENDEKAISEPATPLATTSAQLQAQISRVSILDSNLSLPESQVSSTISANISQIHAILLNPVDHNLHLLKDDTLEFGIITNVQGNHFCVIQPMEQT